MVEASANAMIYLRTKDGKLFAALSVSRRRKDRMKKKKRKMSKGET